jgi:hypothetical protein
MAYRENGVTIKDENSEMYSRSLEVSVNSNFQRFVNGFINACFRRLFLNYVMKCKH